jgi:hypothetical protein
MMKLTNKFMQNTMFTKEAQSDKPNHIRKLAKAREWKRNHPEEVQAMRKAYYEANKAKECAQHLAWTTKNKDKKAIHDKTYKTKHADKAKATHRRWMQMTGSAKYRERYRTDEEYRLRCCLRAGFYQSLRLQNTSKTTSVTQLIGCTMAELKEHLTAQFVGGMSWDNHGEWHIDHRRPVSSYAMADPKQRAACWHFSNLQPLWKKDNQCKSDTWDGVMTEADMIFGVYDDPGMNINDLISET